MTFELFPKWVEVRRGGGGNDFWIIPEISGSAEGGGGEVWGNDFWIIPEMSGSAEGGGKCAEAIISLQSGVASIL